MTDQNLRALAAKLLKHYAADGQLGVMVDEIVANTELDRGKEIEVEEVTAEERNLLNLLGGYMAEANERKPLALTAQGCGDGGGDGGDGGGDGGDGGDDGDDGDDGGDDGDDAGDGEGDGEGDGGEGEGGETGDVGSWAGDLSGVNASDFSSAYGDLSGVNASDFSSAYGDLSGINASDFSSAYGDLSGVNASDFSSAYGDLSGVNASDFSSAYGDLSGVNASNFASAYGDLSGVNAADMALGPSASGQFGLSGPVGSSQEAQEMGVNIAGILGPASTPAAEQQTASNPYGELNVAQISQDFNLNPNAPQYAELTINKSFSPTAMSSTSYDSPTAMSSTGYGPETAMSSTSFGPDADPSYSLDNALGGLGGDGSSAVVPSGLSSLSVATQGQGSPTSAPQFAPAAAITPATPKEIGRAFSLPELNYLLYGYGPESSFFKPAAAQGGYFDADAYFADGGLVATSAPPSQPTVASYPTMAYTDGQGPVGAIAAPPAMPASDLFGSDAPHASPTAPAPAAAAPTLTPDSPFLATNNVNATPVPAPISQNPNLGYSLGLPPLSGLKG